MKNTTWMMLGLAALINPMTTSSALADNATIEDALRSRSDLSSFYQAFVDTGVNHELQPGVSYTVFAPTNEAFAKLSSAQYPCFYNGACRSEIADIVRNHFVPEQVDLTDAGNARGMSSQHGGTHSIAGRFIALGQPARGDRSVDGKNIVSSNQLLVGSVLYKIDGVIANRQELAALEYPAYAYAPADEHVVTTQKTIHGAACNTGIEGDCREQLRGKKTVTRISTVTAPVYVEPAR